MFGSKINSELLKKLDAKNYTCLANVKTKTNKNTGAYICKYKFLTRFDKNYRKWFISELQIFIYFKDFF